MGMTIEEAIGIITSKGNYSYTVIEHQAKNVLIDTARKYQKIEQIVKVWHQDIYAKDFECMAEIAEVVENGNDD